MNAKTFADESKGNAFAARLGAAFGAPAAESHEARIERLRAEHADAFEGVADTRLATLEAAALRGADDATLVTLADAARVSTEPTIVLPRGRLESLSRGRGWARQGTGDAAVWGDKAEGGYRVGPGAWIVGASDGFKRESRTEWAVRNIQVGGETWTVAT